jgi:hypothetical protein
MIFKLDLANAFDRVCHEFMFVIMSKLGFHHQVTRWVKACISCPWIAPLVNGISADFFQVSRGLRQGCPLSPLLYAIQAYFLSFQLDRCLQQRSLLGLNITPRVKNINHTQFSDDTLLLGLANLKSAKKFKEELYDYKEISGSEISLRKRKIYGWNYTPREMLDISRTLDMDGSLAWDSINYLGIPLVKAAPRNSLWLPLLDKIKAKIQAWGASWLNKAGKVVLINSVLASILIYQTSTLLAPKSIVNQIDVLLRRFLWEGGKNGERKIHLVSWDKVKAPKREGGLQIRDVSMQNLAMGGKILWSMINGKASWSTKALWKKYFLGHKERCLDWPPMTMKGSPIFNLFFKARELLISKLYWIPKNGKKIKI